jgi:hypothetical protein
LPAEVRHDLGRVDDKEHADRLVSRAGRCPSLEAFGNALRLELLAQDG